MADHSAELAPGRRFARAVVARAPAARVLAAPWLWISLVILTALCAAVPYVLSISQYVVMPDELGYMKQAVHFAEHLSPSMHGDPWFNSYAQLGPLLFAPAYGLFDTPTAFDVSHVIAAVAFASTAIPVYLLARELTGDAAAGVLAAALSVAVPWLAMSATLMTEPIAYPAFTWALLAMTRALERPSWRRDAVALLAILVATLARTQLVVLGPAFALAAILLRVSPRGPSGDTPTQGSTSLRSHWLLSVVAVAGALALASPGARDALLGSYAGPLDGDLLPAGTLAAGREVLAYIAVGVGGLPLAFAAAWTALSLARPASGYARAFAGTALCVVALLVVATGSFTVGYTAGINDRYLFFVVPILVVATVAMLVERRPAPLALVVAGVLTGALIAASDLAQAGPSLVSPSQTFHQVLIGRTAELRNALGMGSLSMPLLVGALVALATAAVALARGRWHGRRLGLAVGGALLAANVVQTGYTLNSISVTQAGVSPEFLAARNWLDREAPGDAPIGAVVGTLFEPSTTPAAWWDLNFWSKRLDRLYRLPGAADDAQWFGGAMALDERTGRISGLDERDLIITTEEEKRFRLRGAQAVAGRYGFVVWRAPRPYRAAWSLHAQSDIGDIQVGDHGELRVFGDGSPGRRRVTLAVAPSPDSGQGYTLRARAGGTVRTVRVPLGGSRMVRLPLAVPASGVATVGLEVLDPQAVADAQQTGLRVTDVAVAPHEATR